MSLTATRPAYESQSSIDNETALIAKLNQYFGVEILRVTKKFYPCDAVMLKGNNVCALVELKTRRTSLTRFPTYMLSLEKYSRLKAFASSINVPFYLAVQWADKVGIWRGDVANSYSIEIGGRHDRGDSQDLEPVIQIPISEFQTF